VKTIARRSLLPLLILACVGSYALVLQVPWSPPNHKIHVDGTVFAYGGDRILHGDLPYRDFFDHKPPAVYYLNALAFLLWGADAWSVWYLAVAWTIAIGIAFLQLLRRLVPLRYAALATAVFMASALVPGYYEGTNLTEFFGLLPAIVAMLLTHVYLTQGRLWQIAALGTVFASGALLKPTNVATATACVLTVLFLELQAHGTRRTIRSALVFTAPLAAVLILMGAYWWTQGALSDLWAAMVRYNIAYVGDGFALRTLYGTMRSIAASTSLAPLLTVAVAAGALHVSSMRTWPLILPRDRPTHIPAATEWAYVAFFFAVVLEVVFIATAGARFSHYYIALLPPLCASAFYWFRRFPPSVEPSHDRLHPRVQASVGWASVGVWFLVTAGLVRPSSDQIRSFLLDAPREKPLRTNVGKFVEGATGPSETVLTWDVGAEINFETGRRSPSRYFYFLPLFQPGFADKGVWDEFLAELRADPPALILAQWGSGYAPKFDVPTSELAAQCQCRGEVLAGFEAFAEWVRLNYDRELIFGDSYAAYFLRPD